MAQKKIWLTWAGENAQDSRIQAVGQAMAKSGLQVNGNPWVDDLEKLAWTQLDPLLRDNKTCDAWVIALDSASAAKSSIRYGLAVLNATVQNARNLPVFILLMDSAAATFPTPLLSASVLQHSDPAWAGKIVAQLFKQPAKTILPYRFNLRAHPMLGQWFEVGPANASWQGVIFGISHGTPSHHAVAAAGQIPEKTVLEYPAMGIRADIGGVPFEACAVQNTLTDKDSYYIKVDGMPEKVFFGGHPGTDQEEVFVMTLV